jgi:hypothetical protein
MAFRACVETHDGDRPRCDAAPRIVQQAGSDLARAERELARIGRATGRSTSAYSAGARNPRLAPRLLDQGKWLHWSRVANAGSHVLRDEVPGQDARYILLRARRFTPAPVPGVTVRYTVRTAVRWSAWSEAKSIRYPDSSTGDDAKPRPR